VDHYQGKKREVAKPLWTLGENIDWRIEPHLVAKDRDLAGFLEEIQQTGIEI
jgi:hypothetical protein